jgi:hypothetical protein
MADFSFSQLYFLEIKIGDFRIIPQNIVFMNVREWVIDISPRFEMLVKDDGYLHELINFEDNMKITFSLGKHPQDENIVTREFMLLNHKYNMYGNNQLGYVYIIGSIYAPELFAPIKSRSFVNSSSKDVLADIAIECGMNFSFPTNFRTNDRMTWLQANQNNYDFISHVTKRAYKQNDSIFAYIDSNKEFNMTSLETEINKSQFKRCRYDLNNYTKYVFDDPEDEQVVWYNYYDFVNLNGTYNKTNNYGVSFNYFDDTNGNTIETVNKQNSSLANNTFKNSNYVGQNTNNFRFNHIGSTFDDYYLAIVQNEYIRKNFMSFLLTLNVNSFCNVKLFDKLEVAIPSIMKDDRVDINDVWSGNYLAIGIVHSVSEGSIYKKQVITARDGFDKSPYVQTFNNR